jgi:hypothetical protein
MEVHERHSSSTPTATASRWRSLWLREVARRADGERGALMLFPAVLILFLLGSIAVDACPPPASARSSPPQGAAQDAATFALDETALRRGVAPDQGRAVQTVTAAPRPADGGCAPRRSVTVDGDRVEVVSTPAPRWCSASPRAARQPSPSPPASAVVPRR